MPDTLQRPSETSVPTGAAAVGQMLREARETLGLDLQRVAEAIRIRPHFLEAIEAGRFEDLPGGIYPVAFLRGYAAHVRLDVDRVLQVYRSGDAPAVAPPTHHFPVIARERRMPRAAMVLASAFLLVCAYVTWHALTREQSTQDVRVPPVPQRLLADQKTPTAPSGSTASTSTPAPSASAPTTAPTPTSPSATAPAPAMSPPAPPSVPPQAATTATTPRAATPGTSSTSPPPTAGAPAPTTTAAPTATPSPPAAVAPSPPAAPTTAAPPASAASTPAPVAPAPLPVLPATQPAVAPPAASAPAATPAPAATADRPAPAPPRPAPARADGRQAPDLTRGTGGDVKPESPEPQVATAPPTAPPAVPSQSAEPARSEPAPSRRSAWTWGSGEDITARDADPTQGNRITTRSDPTPRATPPAAAQPPQQAARPTEAAPPAAPRARVVAGPPSGQARTVRAEVDSTLELRTATGEVLASTHLRAGAVYTVPEHVGFVLTPVAR